MPFYRMPNGTTYHMLFSGKLKRNPPGACCGKREDGTKCAVLSEFQCDWKICPGVTCSLWICDKHAQEVGPDKHLCPRHQESYKDWMAARAPQGAAR